MTRCPVKVHNGALVFLCSQKQNNRKEGKKVFAGEGGAMETYITLIQFMQ